MRADMKILNELHRLSDRLERIERVLDATGARMLGSAEAAAMLGISVPALHKRVARGAINCAKDDKGRLKFRISDIKTN